MTAVTVKGKCTFLPRHYVWAINKNNMTDYCTGVNVHYVLCEEVVLEIRSLVDINLETAQ